MPARYHSKASLIDTAIGQLPIQTGGGQAVAAQVFLSGGCESANLAQCAQKLVEAASARANTGTTPIVGRVSDLAKSFSLTASPEVFALLAKEARVTAILPEQIDDVFPRPTRIIRE